MQRWKNQLKEVDETTVISKPISFSGYEGFTLKRKEMGRWLLLLH
jgi:hypothetical protein